MANIKDMVAGVLKSEKVTLGGEPVTLEQGEEISMILSQHNVEESFHGGKRKELMVTGTVEYDAVPTYVTEGTTATFRGIDWKVLTLSRGRAATSITFVDQNRID